MIVDGDKMDELCRRLVGMDQDDAEVAVGRLGFRYRTTMINGHGLMKTNDYRLDRVNVHVRDGKIESAHVG